MSITVTIFVLDYLNSTILNLAMLQANKARVSANYGGSVLCETGFNTGRGQWRADIILSNCVDKVMRSGQLSLIITRKDLYVPSLNFVFGLARRDLRAAIVSWHRLRDNDVRLFAERVAKEIVHEVGHLEGLEHCADPSCVMWFSNTLAETDRKGISYCSSCFQKRTITE